MSSSEIKRVYIENDQQSTYHAGRFFYEDDGRMFRIEEIISAFFNLEVDGKVFNVITFKGHYLP